MLTQSPKYYVDLIWCQQETDIVSFAAICTAMIDFLCFVSHYLNLLFS